MKLLTRYKQNVVFVLLEANSNMAANDKYSFNKNQSAIKYLP